MSGAVDAVVIEAAAKGMWQVASLPYQAARKMSEDFACAMEAYNTRAEREQAAFDAQNAAYGAAQQKSREMALQLGAGAIADPNVAFMLGNLGRLKGRVGGGPNPEGGAPTGGAGVALLREIDALIEKAAQGEATLNLAAYEKLAQKVAEFARQNARKSGDKNADLKAFVREELAILKEEIRESQLSTRRFGSKREMLFVRIAEVEKLIESQPLMAAQALELLENRARAEMREAAQAAKKEAENAALLRQFVGEISSNAQAVLSQTILEAPQEQARQILKKLSALLAASPLALSEIETLRQKAGELFQTTQKALDDKANEQFLEEQVAQVLGGLGYNVTRAQNGEGAGEPMVAVLDNAIGVKLNIDGAGNLNGQMVAFSPADAQFSHAQQERVCDLMDAIFDGLRAKNLIVREKKRRNLKPENGVLEVVQRADNQNAVSGAAQSEPQAMRVE